MNDIAQVLNDPWVLIPLVLWSLVWKGFALWHSARNDQRGWFVALLVINTVGLLEIIYLAFFRRKTRILF
ncbi:MAG: DUF5652 family protein [Heliobacteriaceae bacterium]|nr:DUF5652 family protein [Heliobacteriaceae bacterium]MDD4588524.1 DUF5652 family protein [Heliobacteriaceae bacterium]